MKVTTQTTYIIEATEEEVKAIKDNLNVKIQSGQATPTETEIYNSL